MRQKREATRDALKIGVLIDFFFFLISLISLIFFIFLPFYLTLYLTLTLKSVLLKSWPQGSQFFEHMALWPVLAAALAATCNETILHTIQTASLIFLTIELPLILMYWLYFPTCWLFEWLCSLMSRLYSFRPQCGLCMLTLTRAVVMSGFCSWA